MTSEELYYELHLLINKNNNQENINIDKANFVILFNREAEKWLYDKINKNKKDFVIEDAQELYVSNQELKISKETDLFNSYILPDNYFKGDSLLIKADKNCEKILYSYEVLPKEINVYLQDEFNSPSFEWEETIHIYSENNVNVYKKDFSILNCYFSYYKKVPKIDLQGYINLNNELSSNINIDLSDIYKRQILDRVSKEIMRQFENLQGFQLSQERLN